MRRLLFALCLLVLPVLATAQDREALLTPDGTLYTIETQLNANDQYGGAHLLLRSQRGTEVAQEVVPATRGEGSHTEPAIAYDSESKTLFVFWLRHVGIMSSQLMFACRDANGTWSEAESFGRPFDYRENLRIAVTRRTTDIDGTVSDAPAVSVHLVWWEFNSDDGSESARYAMLSIENGHVQTMDVVDLNTFGGPAEKPAKDANAAPISPAVLKQPLLFASPSQDSVLVVFGDTSTGSLHETRVKPTKIVANGRLRVPVGRREGGAGVPRFAVADESRIDGIYGTANRLALYSREGSKLQYVIMKDSAWTETRSIALDDQITSGAAIDALRRLLNEH
ncbi:MAG: hypothetical protein M3Q69_16645 [Acidobacteriota bacterium]|nr:hypothetical protein [Acidobacteriota bacterium]